jgi:HEAT repeat protein
LILTPIRQYLHDPHWEEVFLLLIAQQKEKQVNKIIPQMLNHATPYEQWLHRNLFFAADCLAENVKLTDTSLINQILSRLVECITSDSPLISFRLQQRAEKCLMNLGETDFQDFALKQLEGQQDQLDLVKLQRFRFALGKETSATNSLIRLLGNDDNKVRSQASKALGKLGQANPAVVTALLESLSDENEDVRFYATLALTNLNESRLEVVQALISRLSDDSEDIRSVAAFALGNLGKDDDTVIQGLADCFRDSDDKYVRSWVVGALGKLGRVDQQFAVQFAIAHLSDDNSLIRSRVSTSLGRLGKGNDIALQSLIYCVSNDEAINVRHDAAGALQELSQRDDNVLLLNLLDYLNQVSSPINEVFKSEEQIQFDDALIQALILCLDEGDSDIRFIAGLAFLVESPLKELARVNDAVVTSLQNRLKDEDYYVRFMAVSVLIDLVGHVDDNVVRAFLEYSSNDKKAADIFDAEDLSKPLNEASNSVIQVFLNYLEKGSKDVRSLIAEAFGGQDRAEDKVIQALFHRLADSDHEVRFQAAAALGKLGQKAGNTLNHHPIATPT